MENVHFSLQLLNKQIPGVSKNSLQKLIKPNLKIDNVDYQYVTIW